MKSIKLEFSPILPENFWAEKFLSGICSLMLRCIVRLWKADYKQNREHCNHKYSNCVFNVTPCILDGPCSVLQLITHIYRIHWFLEIDPCISITTLLLEATTYVNRFVTAISVFVNSISPSLLLAFFAWLVLLFLLAKVTRSTVCRWRFVIGIWIHILGLGNIICLIQGGGHPSIICRKLTWVGKFGLWLHMDTKWQTFFSGWNATDFLLTFWWFSIT